MGDAGLIDWPETDTADAAEAFYDYGYLRENPAGWYEELWVHEAGETSWRESIDGEVMATRGSVGCVM